MLQFIKKALFTLTAIFIFLAVSFVILEVARRIENPQGPINELFSITQQGKDFLSEPNSVKTHTSPDTEETFEIHVNKYGYRGKDFEMPKPEGRIRIFAVGDSFTHGVGMPDENTIPYLIEQHLKKNNINGEVINAGIGHTSPLTHYMNIKNIHLGYQPDMVLLLFDFTDLWDDWHSERMAIMNKEGEIERFDINYLYGKRSLWRTCDSHSSACRYINNKIVRTFRKINALGLKEYIKVCKEGKRAKAAIIQSEKIRDEETLTEYDGLLMLRGLKRKELIDKHWQRTAKYILKIRDLLKRNGIPLVLVTYPHGLYVGEEEWSEGRETWGFELHKKYTDYYPFELVENFAKQNNIPYMSTLDDFLKAEKKTYFYKWDGHLNPEGNKIVAEGIVNKKSFKNALNKIMADKSQRPFSP